MSSDVEEEQQQEEKPFAVERAKTGRAKCKRCKCPIEKGEIRIAKYVASFFSDGKLMPAWHHVTCMFDAFTKQRASTRRIDDPAEDIKGWEELSDDDRKIIRDKLQQLEKSCNYRVCNAFTLVHLLRPRGRDLIALLLRCLDRDQLTFVPSRSCPPLHYSARWSCPVLEGGRGKKIVQRFPGSSPMKLPRFLIDFPFLYKHSFTTESSKETQLITERGREREISVLEGREVHRYPRGEITTRCVIFFLAIK